jgi:hypothetical protein
MIGGLHSRRVACVLLLSLFAVAPAVGSDDTADEDEPKLPKLKRGQTVEARITAGATHAYRLKAKPGSLRIVVSAAGIAVAAVLVTAGGATIAPSAAPDGQAFDLAPTEPEILRLEIRAAGGGEDGRYTVRVGT